MTGHAANILAHLDAQRCIVCGGPAVRGAKICLACAAGEDQSAGDRQDGVRLTPDLPEDRVDPTQDFA